MRAGNIFDKVDAYTLTIEAKKIGIYPYFREIVSEQDTEVILKNGRKVLMLGSNSYLGLTNHPQVKEAAIQAVRKYGSGCAGSRFLNGTLDLHHELEDELADFVGKEAALLYTTGFQVNQGVIATLLGRNDHVILDKYDHASIIDGAALSLARSIRFSHNDIESLDKILADIPPDKGKFIVTEGVFSMHGDIARLPEIIELAEKHQAVVMIDDAHALGVIWPGGQGTAAHFGLTDKVEVIMGTFSKSLASIGGFAASDQQTIEYLKHHSRALIFSASPPPASAAAALAALRIIKREPERLQQLWQNTALMRSGLQSLGYDTGRSETPIIPVFIGEMMNMIHMNVRLEEEGLFVNPVIPPAVPPSECLLRISLMATHTPKQIEFALDKLEKTGREFGVR
ncbi:MAG: pyridoxal phosphate-dependent aminotransferase family protein [Pseudomonadota bacterium]